VPRKHYQSTHSDEGVALQILMVNLLFLIVASAKYPADGGIGTLFDGDCHYVESSTTWLHVAINALSSLLLSVSNYTMQALASPTRQEVDRAHAKGDWVDIGVASVRNVFGRISKRRTACWWLLGLSSVPIHLLYSECGSGLLLLYIAPSGRYMLTIDQIALSSRRLALICTRRS